MGVSFRLEGLAGVGSYGVVYNVTIDGKPYVVKVDRRNWLLKREMAIHTEIYNALGARCKRFVPAPYVPKDGDVVDMLDHLRRLVGGKRAFAMEYVDGVTLHTFVSRTKDYAKLSAVRENLKKAVMCLWKAGYIHADLHMANVMVARNLDVKIIDFGYASRVDPLLKTDRASVRAWFASHWAPIKQMWRLADMNPNVHAYGLQKKYGPELRMYARGDEQKYKELHANLSTHVKGAFPKLQGAAASPKLRRGAAASPKLRRGAAASVRVKAK